VKKTKRKPLVAWANVDPKDMQSFRLFYHAKQAADDLRWREPGWVTIRLVEAKR